MTWVYLHAAAHNRTLWLPHARGPCLDLPGHGEAERVDPPTVEAYAATLIPRLPDSPVLIGHSLGGMVALEIARQLRDRVQALVLLDAPIKLPFDLFHRTLHMTTDYSSPELFSIFAGTRVRDPHLRRSIKAAVRAMTPGGLKDAALAASFYDGRPALSALSIPTLGLYVRTSAIAGPFAATAIRKYAPTATVEMVNGSHMYPLEHIRNVDDRISRFLAEEI